MALGGRSAEGVPARHRMLVWACITAITLLAWGYLVYLDRQAGPGDGHDAMMAGMGMAMQRPWTGADLLSTFAMWAIMMVGMMTGSAAPVMLLYGRMHAMREGAPLPPLVLCFGLGYVAVWAAFSLAMTLLQWALHETMLLSPAMALADRRTAGALLCLAGIYQLTPWKQVCLAHCRSPLGFLLSHWRNGKQGAFLMGMRHGAYCLGCCWALMTVLFVTGVMALAWVAVLALLVLLEKLGPAGLRVAQAAGVVMIGAGVLLFWLAGAPAP